MLVFEWSPWKNDVNIRKHGIDFGDAITIFSNFTLVLDSNRNGEERFKAIGMLRGREVAVVYTIRGDTLRIISARRARKDERTAYHAAYTGRSWRWAD